MNILWAHVSPLTLSCTVANNCVSVTLVLFKEQCISDVSQAAANLSLLHPGYRDFIISSFEFTCLFLLPLTLLLPFFPSS